MSLRRALLAPLALTVGLVAAAPLGAQARPAARSAFSVLGDYALVLRFPEAGPEAMVMFGITVTDSAGRLGGVFTGSSGRSRPLEGVTAEPDSNRVVVRFRDQSGPAVLTLRFRGDSVFGAAVYDDGSFPVSGRRVPPG